LLSGEELPELLPDESDKLPEESDEASDESDGLVEIEQPSGPRAARATMATRKPSSKKRERTVAFMRRLSGRAAHAVKRARA
jgi:hypothetical protein